MFLESQHGPLPSPASRGLQASWEGRAYSQARLGAPLGGDTQGLGHFLGFRAGRRAGGGVAFLSRLWPGP